MLFSFDLVKNTVRINYTEIFWW